MNIYELTFASYVYSSLEDFDKTYVNFLGRVKNNPNMNVKANREALIDWLNDWGCRNFYIKYHDLASKELHEWYQENELNLPVREKNIWELDFDDLNAIQALYDLLTVRIASYAKCKNGKTKINTFGHTPSSKILFALRPKSLIPWDGEMRKEFKQKYSFITYKKFLLKVIDEINELMNSCKESGFELKDIPIKLNKSYATIPKLVDEYHWITITKKCKPPSNETLNIWLKWNS